MIKQKTVLEVKLGERLYEFTCSSDSPLGEVHDALSAMKSQILEIMVERDKQVKAPEQEVKE